MAVPLLSMALNYSHPILLHFRRPEPEYMHFISRFIRDGFSWIEPKIEVIEDDGEPLIMNEFICISIFS